MKGNLLHSIPVINPQCQILARRGRALPSQCRGGGDVEPQVQGFIDRVDAENDGIDTKLLFAYVGDRRRAKVLLRVRSDRVHAWEGRDVAQRRKEQDGS